RDDLAATEFLFTSAALFQQNGFDGTALSQLASETGLTVAEIEERYPHKEDLVLALYHVLGAESLSEITGLPRSTVAQRYQLLLQQKLHQLAPHEDALSALFATAMRRTSPIQAADIAPGKRDAMFQVFATLVEGANDAPQNAQEAEDMALMLYGLYHYALLFWLYDRTEEKRATELMLTMVYEFLKLSRPLLMTPLLGKSISKMGRVLMLIFGGARLVESPTRH
ncbi:MAG: TetR/AcrR family transcriptional regulator, partial [Anaerolineae bacterium]|nr:TetR/AcrR family transcriptional regulator [Anaerolineae bacterium]